MFLFNVYPPLYYLRHSIGVVSGYLAFLSPYQTGNVELSLHSAFRLFESLIFVLEWDVQIFF